MTVRNSRLRVLVAASLAAAVVACGGPDVSYPAHPAASSSIPLEVPKVVEFSWGPNSSDLAKARELIAGWDENRLAGQLIVGRFRGTDPAVAADSVRRLHLAGMSVQGSNVANKAQVLALTDAVAEAHKSDGRTFPPIIGVDQEGGTVEHLRGVATDFPPFSAAGAVLQADPEGGEEIIEEAARTLGLELRDFGFTWVFAPVADVTAPGDVTIGTRSPSSDPKIASRAVEAAIAGYYEAGVVSTPKHFPGHGSVTADSHLTLPNLTKSRAQLDDVDLKPFESAVAAGANAVMIGHLNVQAIAPGMPSTISPAIYSLLRNELGFEGIAITDSMGMGAVTNRPEPEVAALKAGADLVLMPADNDRAHSSIVNAIRNGTLDRKKIEDSAARVVALQLWQARVAGEHPVPADITAQAQAAAAALEY